MNIFDKKTKIETIQNIEFSSERKRSSIIYKYEDKIILYCKGADNVIENLLASY